MKMQISKLLWVQVCFILLCVVFVSQATGEVKYSQPFDTTSYGIDIRCDRNDSVYKIVPPLQ